MIFVLCIVIQPTNPTMKRLILIQNDFSGAGKTTLSQCLHQYLQSYRVAHHCVAIVESTDDSRPVAQIEAATMRRQTFVAELDRSDLVIMEVDSGMGDLFTSFYRRNELETLLPELGIELAVLIPVTSDRECFDGVTEAASVYSDSAQYLIVHTPTGSCYDDDERAWERSYAARVMDMFEAADMEMPVISESLDLKLKLSHRELPQMMMEPTADAEMQQEMSKWFRRVSSQIETARNHIFGDAFRPTIAIAPEPKRRGRAKSKVATEAAA